jgi:hypothetical protein
MSYMNIKRSEKDPAKFEVNGVANHTIYEAVVDEHTARLLERAREAGRSEMSSELRKLLELNW